MSSAQDPFYIVKEEIEVSVQSLNKVLRWPPTHCTPLAVPRLEITYGKHFSSGPKISNIIELSYQTQTNTSTSEYTKGIEQSGKKLYEPMALIKQIHLLYYYYYYAIYECSSYGINGYTWTRFYFWNVFRVGSLVLVLLIFLPVAKASSGRKVDELDKTIAVAARDPSWYGIDEAELDKRRRWTTNAHSQVGNIKKSVMTGKQSNGTSTSSVNGMRRELMRLPDSLQTDKFNQYAAQDNDDFISSESDRQLLLMRQQDDELDKLSAGVQRIGGVGLTIHEELTAQEKIIDELGTEMNSTATRLDFVQKKVAMVMKKAGAKGQIMMISFLLALFIVLFVLVFLT